MEYDLDLLELITSYERVWEQQYMFKNIYQKHLKLLKIKNDKKTVSLGKLKI